MSDNQQQSANSGSILNRLVAVLTPLFALLAASLAAWVGKHIPGAKLDPAQITSLMVAVATAALTMAIKWLHGWQQHEAHLRQSGGGAVRQPTDSTGPSPLAAVATDSKTA